MRTFIEHFLKTILVIAADYGIFSFIHWDINLSHWGWFSRLLFMIFTTYGLIKVHD
jgi:hypothetical protein